MTGGWALGWAWQQAGARGRERRACGRQARGQARARSGSGVAWARGRRRQGRAGRPAGRPVRVWCAQLGQVGCFGARDLVFGLV